MHVRGTVCKKVQNYSDAFSKSSSKGQFVDTVGSKMRDNMTIPVSFFIETGK